MKSLTIKSLLKIIAVSFFPGVMRWAGLLRRSDYKS